MDHIVHRRRSPNGTQIRTHLPTRTTHTMASHATDIASSEDGLTASCIAFREDIRHKFCHFRRSGWRRILGNPGRFTEDAREGGIAATDGVQIPQRPQGNIDCRFAIFHRCGKLVRSVPVVAEGIEQFLEIVLCGGLRKNICGQRRRSRQIQTDQTRDGLHSDGDRSVRLSQS